VLWGRERYAFLKQSEIRDQFRKAAARSECHIDALGSLLMISTIASASQS
jgi:hypothetical protein